MGGRSWERKGEGEGYSGDLATDYHLRLQMTGDNEIIPSRSFKMPLERSRAKPTTIKQSRASSTSIGAWSGAPLFGVSGNTAATPFLSGNGPRSPLMDCLPVLAGCRPNGASGFVLDFAEAHPRGHEDEKEGLLGCV
jgi:hypothetical protein